MTGNRCHGHEVAVHTEAGDVCNIEADCHKSPILAIALLYPSVFGLRRDIPVSVTLLQFIGRLLGEHRIQRKFSQHALAVYSGISQSKITKIERGVYPGLSVQDFCYLADDLDLDISIRLLRKGVLMQTRTGSIEYFPEAATGAAHCSGQGFTIVWQKGALCTQSDRNGATVEDILVAALKRLDEFQSGDFCCQETQMAMECLTKATYFLKKRQRSGNP